METPMKSFKMQTVLPLNQVNRNNRFISEEVAQKMLDNLPQQAKEGGIAVRLNFPREEWPRFAECELAEIQGFAKMFIQDHKLMADIDIIDDGNEVRKFICDGLDKGSLVPAPYGTGNIDMETRDGSGKECEVLSNWAVNGIGIISKDRSVLANTGLSPKSGVVVSELVRMIASVGTLAIIVGIMAF